MENGKQSAFPLMWDQRNNPQFKTEEGLTKREYFAAMAMQGIIAAHTPLYTASGGNTSESAKTKAEVAVALADALLAELDKPLTNH